MFRTVRVENFYFAILGICMRREFGHDSAHSCSGTMDTLVIPHDDVIKSRHFSRYWPFARGIHRSAVNSPHKGQWRGALMFSMAITLWYLRMDKYFHPALHGGCNYLSKLRGKVFQCDIFIILVLFVSARNVFYELDIENWGLVIYINKLRFNSVYLLNTNKKGRELHLKISPTLAKP